MKNKLVIIYPKIDDKHTDSFWYDNFGDNVLIATYGDRRLYACGDIRIIDTQKGELVFDGKERNGGFERIKLKSDKDLGRLEEKGYEWGNNNWFEITYIDEDGYVETYDTCGDYDEAIKILTEEEENE